MSARRIARVLAAVALPAALVTTLLGCPHKDESTAPDAGAGAAASASASGTAEAGPTTTADGKELVRVGCLSCHSEHMLAQQRLTQAQWQKTVLKMMTWGANVDPTEVAPLVAYLSTSYGPDAGAYVAEPMPASEALAEVAVLPDGPIPAGDAARGKTLFVDKCGGCHGQDARGALGVNLVDRTILYRAADFATTVRRGRGKMLPIALDDAQMGDVLAHLRGLRNPPLR